MGESSAGRPTVSVVICTWNRAPLLRDCLRSLEDQTVDPAFFEVVVVDNNSSDGTAAVVSAFAARRPAVRGVREARQGLSHARNRGWDEARGRYVAYLDDDGKAPPEWLAVARQIIAARTPEVFGGPYYAIYNAPRPKWWKDSYRSFKPGEEARALGPADHLSGGNLFVRREVLAETGGFDPGLGMSGHRIAAGEETRLIREIRRRRHDALVYYDPRLYVYHLVHPAKMRWRWLFRYWFAKGRDAWKVFYGASPAGSRAGILAEGAVTLAALAGSLLRAGLLRDREAFPYPQNFVFERTSRHVIALGALFERLSWPGR